MMEPITDRITRYLLARIRRRAILDLYENAATVGLLEEHPIAGDQRCGTVWTVPDDTLHLMTGDQRNDYKLVGRRLGTSMPAGSSVALQFFDIEADSDAALEVRPRTKSKVKQRAASAIGNGSTFSSAARGKPPKATARDVLALVRQQLPAPNVAYVAVALLVARAVGSSIPDIAALRGSISRTDVFALIKAPVPRFERRFTQMLEGGILLPHRIKVADVHHGTSLREEHRDERKAKPRRPARLMSGDRARLFEHAALSQKLGDALLDRSVPIIVVDETSLAPPPSLSLTADVVFECTGLDHVLLAELLHITLGIAPTLSLKRMEAEGLELEGLSIDDLALAIRQSHDLDTILATLATLGDTARSRDEGDEGKDSDRQHVRSGRETKSKNRNGASREADKTSASSDSVDIIQPLKPPASETGAAADVAASAPIEAGADSHLRNVRIETLSGYGEARQWALDLKDDLQIWRDGDLSWSEMSTKLLLSGPPGTGKTTYAKALCNTLQLPLLVTSVAIWLEPGYLGDVLKRMSQAFETARANAPSILFIDEIDNIGTRGGGRREQNDDYWRSLINRLLELLDGASKTDGVIVVAATNLPDRIDPALLRSGRLEKHVAIPMPDTNALSDILAHHLAGDLAGVLSSAPNRTEVERLPLQRSTDRDRQRRRKTVEPRKASVGEEAPQ